MTTLRRAVVCTFLTLGPAVSDGQGTTSPWVGRWTLNVTQSTVGAPLAGPSGFTVVSQTLTLEETAGDLRLSGETLYSDDQGQHTARDDQRMSLTGAPTQIGPVSLRFERLGGATGFTILSDVTLSGGRLDEVSRFAVSRDGQTLTETKTQSYPSGSPAARTSTSVLIFSRVSSKE